MAQHRRADGRPDDPRDQHLRHNAQPLEQPHLLRRGVGTHHGAEHGGAGKVARHHAQRAEEHRHRAAGEIQHQIPGHQQGDARQNGAAKAPGIIPAAVKGGEHRRQHDGRRHDEDVIFHAEGFFVVQDEVGHEDLDGDPEAREGQQGEIQHLVLPHHRGAEAVQNAAPVAAGGRGGDAGFPDEPEAGKPDDHDHHADDGKDGNPALGLLQVKEHKAAEYRQNGQHRHHGVDALRRAAVGIVGGIGEPGIEAGVIGGGAEEGHDAIHDDDEIDADGIDRDGDPDGGGDHICPDERKAEDGNAPQQIARADEQLAAAHTVAERADEDGGKGGRDRRSGDHEADLGGGGVEHLVDKDIEVHIFHDPRDLTHQRENGKRQPEPGAELGLFHRDPAFPRKMGNA